MNCPNCHQPLREGALFCTKCGARTTGGRDSSADSVPTAEPSARGGGTNPTIINKDALLGRVLDGKYEIVAPLGEGGMGAVYRARRVHIGDEVAVKVLHPRFVNDSTLVERFRREARAAAQLHHQNVVTIHDYGEAGGAEALAYIVMELVRGDSLRGLLQNEGRLEVSRAVSLMRDICSGVGAAHRRGIVHRDLKPDNIIVLPPDDDHDGERAKVVDFGIAKLRDMASDSTLTQAGAVVGTPFYMSPEQCRGESLDARADVYSLGAMLYEMLAGEPPFTAPSITGVIAKHLTEAPPRIPESLNVPGQLQETIMRALAKEPEARQADASEFARTILAAEGEAKGESKPVETPPPPVFTGGGQPAPVVPIQPQPSQVPTSHAPVPVPTDPRQFAPPTQNQPPPAPHPAPPPQQYRPAPPPPRKSRAPLFVGLFVLFALFVGVAAVAALFYFGGNNKGGTTTSLNVNLSATPHTGETATPPPGNANDTAKPDVQLSDAMRRAESKLISDTPLKREDLDGLTPAELRLLRNALFARHGRVFQDGELKKFFEGRDWYEPNTSFSESLLTANDRANAELIKSVESGGPSPADAARINTEVADTLKAWADTTRARLLDLHMNYYADTLDTYYKATNVSAAKVRADRARAFQIYDTMDVELTNVKVTPDPSGARATVTFDKKWDFEGDEKHTTGSVQQMLTFSKVGGRWLITGEKELQVHYTNSETY